jgi:hypothetical protein
MFELSNRQANHNYLINDGYFKLKIKSCKSALQL